MAFGEALVRSGCFGERQYRRERDPDGSARDAARETREPFWRRLEIVGNAAQRPTAARRRRLDAVRRESPQTLGGILAPRIHYGVRAEPADERRRAAPRGGGQPARTAVFRELHGHRSHGAGRAEDEERLAVSQRQLSSFPESSCEVRPA